MLIHALPLYPLACGPQIVSYGIGWARHSRFSMALVRAARRLGIVCVAMADCPDNEQKVQSFLLARGRPALHSCKPTLVTITPWHVEHIACLIAA